MGVIRVSMEVWSGEASHLSMWVRAQSIRRAVRVVETLG